MKNIFTKKYWVNAKRKRHFLKNMMSNNEWGFTYIYIIIRQKLNVLKSKKNIYYMFDAPNELRWLKVAIKLCRHLSNEEWKYPEHINYHNAKRFKKALNLKFYGNLPDKKRRLSGEELDRLNLECLYDIKAKHLLFNILNTYIKDWWE